MLHTTKNQSQPFSKWASKVGGPFTAPTLREAPVPGLRAFGPQKPMGYMTTVLVHQDISRAAPCPHKQGYSPCAFCEGRPAPRRGRGLAGERWPRDVGLSARASAASPHVSQPHSRVILIQQA